MDRETLRRHARACEVIRLSQDDWDRNQCVRIVTDIWGDVTEAQKIRRGAAIRGGSWYMTRGGSQVFFLGGVSTETRRNFALAYETENLPPPYPGWNGAALEDMERYVFLPTRLVNLHVRNIYLYGHSAGGAVIAMAYYIFTTRFIPPVVEAATFGAPMPGFSTVIEVNRNSPYYRYMNVGDPIPWVPRALPVVAGLSAAREQALRDYYARCNQVPGGIGLSNTDLRVSLGRSCLLPVATQRDLAIWALTPDSANLHPHRIQVYESNLDRAASRAPGPALPGALAVESTVVPRPPRQLISPAAALHRFVKLFSVGNASPGSPAPLGVETLTMSGGGSASMATFIPHSLRPKHQKVGDQWTVVWLNNIVGNYPTATKARTQARGLYRAARTLLACQSIPVSAFLSSWDNFLQAASTSGSGIKPTIAVT